MKLDQITNTELSILQVLWQRGEATSKEIADVLYEEVTAPKLASSQKLIERLEAKGCVQRNRSERAHRFRPLVTQEAYLRDRLQSLADRLCDGEITPLVTTLLRTKSLPRKQRDEVRSLIEDLWPSK